jgi:hypothetical protein
VVDQLLDDDGCQLRNLIAKSFEIAAEMGADTVFNGLDNLGRGFILFDETFDFIDGKAAESALELRGYAARESSGTRKNGSDNRQKQDTHITRHRVSQYRMQCIQIFCFSSAASLAPRCPSLATQQTTGSYQHTW